MYWRSLYEICYLKGDICIYASTLGIALSFLYHIGVDIRSDDIVCPTWVYIFFERCASMLEEIGIKIRMALDRKISVESRGNISREHRGLDHDCPAATKGIIERSAILPSRKRYECSSEIFFDRCIACFAPVSSFVEGSSSDIEGDMCGVFEEKYLNMRFMSIRMLDEMCLSCGFE